MTSCRESMRNFILSCMSVLRFGLVFSIILFGQQTRGFFVGIVSGHIGVTALDGTYLGISLVNLLSHLPLLGVTSAIDVLGVAALSKSSSKHEVGLVVQRTLLVCLLLSSPLVALLLLLKPLLLYMNQDPVSLEAAVSVLHLSIIIVPINAVSLCMAKYLFIINRQRAVVYSVVVTLGAGLAILTLVTFSLNVSLLTLHWCYLLTECLQPLLLLGYFLSHKVHLRTWAGFSIQALAGWTNILITGLPSCGLIILEWGMYEVFVLILGGSQNPEFIRVNSVGFTVICISYLLQYGISVSATTHISQCIASGKVDDARKYIRTSITSSLLIALLLVLAGLAGKKMFSLLMVPSAYLDGITPWIIAYTFLDSYQIVLNGILRGLRRHILPLVTTVLGFIIALVTGSVLLLRPTLVIASVWIGLCAGCLFSAVVLTGILLSAKLDADSDNVINYRFNTDSDTVTLVSDRYTVLNQFHVDIAAGQSGQLTEVTVKEDSLQETNHVGNIAQDKEETATIDVTVEGVSSDSGVNGDSCVNGGAGVNGVLRVENGAGSFDRGESYRLILTKGSLFIAAFILVCTAASVNINLAQF